MRGAITQAYSQHNSIKIMIAGKLGIDLTVTENKHEIPIKSLFTMAARKNKKREFLFVSKILGKHIAIKPEIVQIGGSLLAYKFAEEIEKKDVSNEIEVLVETLTELEQIPKAISIINSKKIIPDEATLFIGFAETATGLGHAMYATFLKNAGFVHSTRHHIKELESVVTFEEEHSHATSHLFYTSKNDFISNFLRIVLVDDEITTGKTALNLIRALNKKFPGKKYTVAALLDWRSDEDVNEYKKLEAELGVDVNVVSLIKGKAKQIGNLDDFSNKLIPKRNPGDIHVDTIIVPLKNKHAFTFINSCGNEKEFLYSNINGRFGICAEDNQAINEIVLQTANMLKNYRQEGNCLCLGFDEFIYIPAMISSHMGESIYYHSTTRSPVYPINKEEYGIKTAISFNNPYDPGVINYIYNVLPNQYQEVYLFLESDIEQVEKMKLSMTLSQYGIGYLRFVVFC